MLDVSSLVQSWCPMLCIVAAGIVFRLDGSNSRTLRPIPGARSRYHLVVECQGPC
jgi:hypothetical protein